MYNEEVDPIEGTNEEPATGTGTGEGTEDLKPGTGEATTETPAAGEEKNEVEETPSDDEDDED